MNADRSFSKQSDAAKKSVMLARYLAEEPSTDTEGRIKSQFFPEERISDRATNMQTELADWDKRWNAASSKKDKGRD
ncbi:hypothetical protein E8E14_011502 [Neopestalotiopsis sp. 37M]|nr:hypothetical protein E8E14_011502 [Neopestalotiopsis sp. 37M]